MAENKGTALVTGASSGIGATYADRLARRGYDLILVARNAERLEANARRIRADYKVDVEVLPADLSTRADTIKIANRLSSDAAITLLVNNAGVSLNGGIFDNEPAALENLIAVNITAPTLLASAAGKAFGARDKSEGGQGAIVNIASVLALAPEISFGIYSATKAFVLTLSQSLQVELGSKGIYVQAVLPAATRTEIWERSGRDINTIPGMMEVGDLVDAALVGFDRKESVTIPPLPDHGQWETFNSARQAMLPNFRQEQPAARYRVA